MKIFFTLIILIVFGSIVHAQEKRYIFIQSENRQPFYVSLNNKIISSTASGYVIIPQLKDGEYAFAIGFAKNEFPEQPFKISINKNVGLSLKSFGEKGWGLFNIQSLSITMAGEVRQLNAVKELPVQKEEALISFDVKPAQVIIKIEDSAVTSININDNAPAKKVEDINPVIVSAEEKSNDQVAIVNTPSEPKQGSSKKSKAKSKNVQKVLENNTTEGVALTFTDLTGKMIDTINILIPSSNPAESNVEVKTSSTDNQKEAILINTTGSNSANGVLKGLDSEVEKSSVDNGNPAVKNVTISPSNTCTSPATEDDYSKLRKKMAKETNDEDMLKEAKKFYKVKCFSTMQIKNLSTLFLSDEGRLLFFQNSYEFVSDPENYSVLNKEFIDPVVINRFNSLFTK